MKLTFKPKTSAKRFDLSLKNRSNYRKSKLRVKQEAVAQAQSARERETKSSSSNSVTIIQNAMIVTMDSGSLVFFKKKIGIKFLLFILICIGDLLC
jgi:hypothetical protein